MEELDKNFRISELKMHDIKEVENLIMDVSFYKNYDFPQTRGFVLYLLIENSNEYTEEERESATEELCRELKENSGRLSLKLTKTQALHLFNYIKTEFEL